MTHNVTRTELAVLAGEYWKDMNGGEHWMAAGYMKSRYFYKAFYSLERKGFIEVEPGTGWRPYRVTGIGKAMLECVYRTLTY